MMGIRHFFSSTFHARSRFLGCTALLVLSMATLILAGCQDQSEPGGGMPALPSAEIGQFNILAASPFPDNIPVGTTPAQLLSALAGSYWTGADTFGDWAMALGDCADYAGAAGETIYGFQTTQAIFQALAVACDDLGDALSAGNSAAGQAAASALAMALSDLANKAQQDGFPTLAAKFTLAAAQANVLANQIGQGLTTQSQLIAVLEADLAFRDTLQAVADETSTIVTGYSLMMQSRAAPLYYYIARTKYQALTATPVSATTWVLISAGHYTRNVTWNRDITSLDTETSYWTLWDAIWNINGFDYTVISQTVTQTQTTVTQHFFSVSGTPSANLPPAYSRVLVQSRVIYRQRITGAIGGG